MPSKQTNQKSSKKTAAKAKSHTTPATGGDVSPAVLPHQPGVTPGSVDVTGIVPEDVHVDPEITEGHPGYEESGPSEIMPPKSSPAKD